MIEFDQVTLGYGDAAPVLREVTFTVPEGDLALVIGGTGSGKSTLMKAINGLMPHATGGRVRGRVTVAGRDTAAARPRDFADLVGYVGQDPAMGFVTDTVEEEIAFGMEQAGVAPQVMRARVEESLDLMGVADLRHRPLHDLSGGQQQRVAIASVLATHPRVLVLDEPTSSLDPSGAHDVLSAISALVHSSGLTVVLAEHRLERVLHVVDTVHWVRPDGRVESGPPEQVLARADVRPPLAELAGELGWSRVPLSVREARRRVGAEQVSARAPEARPEADGAVALTCTGLSVSYGRQSAVHPLDLQFRAGTVTAVMGRTGSGKSSLLWALHGSGRRSAGTVRIGGVTAPAVKRWGRVRIREADASGSVDPAQLPPAERRRAITLVPQNSTDLVYLDTVAEELAQADTETGSAAGTAAALLADLGGIDDHSRHPRDLSEGQRLLLVLAIQLLGGPQVVLLDEPTRGLDYQAKARLSRICRALAADGVSVIVSSHDVEFVVQVSDRTVVLAEGEVVADDSTRAVCTATPGYAPQVAAVFHPTAVLTVAEVLAGMEPS